MADINRKLDIYRKEEEIRSYLEAKDLFEKDLNIFRQKLPKNHIKIAWAIESLGYTHCKLRNYALAEEQLKECLEIYKKHHSGSHWRFALIFSYLGDVYRDIKQVKKATDFYKLSLSIYDEHYKSMAINSAYVSINLGQVYLMNNEFIMAEKMMKKALIIFEKSNHPDIYEIYENLADLNLKKADEIKEDMKKVEYKALAVSYLKKAIKVLEKHFPKESPHRLRLENKLKM